MLAGLEFGHAIPRQNPIDAHVLAVALPLKLMERENVRSILTARDVRVYVVYVVVTFATYEMWAGGAAEDAGVAVSIQDGRGYYL